MFVLVYNLVWAIMIAAAKRQGVAVERLSFADALHWLRHAGPDDPLPTLLCVPHRPGSVERRAVKRRPRAYALLNRPREQLQCQLRKSP